MKKSKILFKERLFIKQCSKLHILFRRWQINNVLKAFYNEIAKHEALIDLYPQKVVSPFNDALLAPLGKKKPIITLKEYGTAILLLKRVLKIRGNETYSILALASLYYLNGEVARCYSICKHLVSEKILNHKYYYLIGKNALIINQPNFAIDCFTSAIKYHKENYEYYLFRALAYKEIDNNVEGLADINFIIAQGYTARTVLYLKARFEYYLNPTKENGEQFIIQLELYTKSSERLHEIAHVYRDLKQYEKSLEYMNLVIAMEPNDAECYACIANIKIKLGMFQEAHTDASYALVLDATTAKAYRNRARAYIGLNKIDLAIQDFQKYLEFCPEDEEVEREFEDLIRRLM